MPSAKTECVLVRAGQGREKVASGEREGSTMMFDSACSLVSIS